jgi:hypothetical protein
MQKRNRMRTPFFVEKEKLRVRARGDEAAGL